MLAYLQQCWIICDTGNSCYWMSIKARVNGLSTLAVNIKRIVLGVWIISLRRAPWSSPRPLQRTHARARTHAHAHAHARTCTRAHSTMVHGPLVDELNTFWNASVLREQIMELLHFTKPLSLPDKAISDPCVTCSKETHFQRLIISSGVEPS